MWQVCFVYIVWFETGSLWAAQAGLGLVVYLPQPLGVLGFRCATPSPT